MGCRRATGKTVRASGKCRVVFRLTDGEAVDVDQLDRPDGRAERSWTAPETSARVRCRTFRTRAT